MRSVATLLSLLLFAGHAAAQERRVAVLEPAGAANATERRSVFAQLRASLDQVEGFTVADAQLIYEEVEAAKSMGLRCSAEDSECLARLAALLPAELMVVPTLAAHTPGEDPLLDLEVYDSATGGLLHRVKRSVPPPGPDRVGRMRQIARELLTPEKALGTLIVRTVAPLVEVQLDSEPPRQGPQARFTAIRSGPHVLVGRGEGREVIQSVEVVAGQETSVTLSLPDVPEAGLAEPTEGETGVHLPLLITGASIASIATILAVGAVGVSSVVLADLAEFNTLTQTADYPTRQLYLGGAYAGFAVGVVSLGVLGVGLALAAAGFVL